MKQNAAGYWLLDGIKFRVYPFIICFVLDN